MVVLFVVVVVTIMATYTLNSLISDEVEEVSSDIALRSLRKKNDNLQDQFRLLQKPLFDARELTAKQSDTSSALQHLEILSDIQRSDSSVVSIWYGIKRKDKNLEIYRLRGDRTEILWEESLGVTAKVIRDQNRVLWRNTVCFETPFGLVFYGYDLDLHTVQRRFWDIDIYSQSYAYVFDADGLCMLHPDTTYIGKNVFEFSLISPSDTLLKAEEGSQRVMASEYLQLDVVNYIRRLKLQGGSYYLSVNFPKSINEQDISRIKQYSFYIYLISTLLLLFVFYYFARAVLLQYRKQEQLREEKTSLALEKEVYQKESALLQLQQLKNQINPHFLFNSLNALYTLIDHDTKLSKTFALKLSKLYRYLIQSPKEDITGVKVELEFIDQYLFLQGIRFGDRMRFETELQNRQALQKKIPYLSLQTLVENALKHNVATKKHPLCIKIVVESHRVVVSNTYQPKEQEQQGSRFGLQYLRGIYDFYKTTGFETSIRDGWFYCELPLL